MQCERALSAREICELVRQRIPTALRQHKNALTSVTTVLNRLVRSGKHAKVYRQDGLRVWRWVLDGTDEGGTGTGTALTSLPAIKTDLRMRGQLRGESDTMTLRCHARQMSDDISSPGSPAEWVESRGTNSLQYLCLARRDGENFSIRHSIAPRRVFLIKQLRART